MLCRTGSKRVSHPSKIQRQIIENNIQILLLFFVADANQLWRGFDYAIMTHGQSSPRYGIC